MDFWTVESGELIHYKRTGECNQCGECCESKHTIGYKVEVEHRLKDTEEDKDFDWACREGWNMFLAQRLWWYFKTWSNVGDGHRCSQLTLKGQCRDHNDPIEMPAICTYWPMHPSHVAAFPSCSYSFERIEEDAVGDA